MCGTPVRSVSSHKKFDQVGRGGQGRSKSAQEMDLVWIKNSQRAPKWVKDPGNGLKSIRGSGGYHLGSISVVFGPFRGLRKARKPN